MATVFCDNFYGRPVMALLLAALGIGVVCTVKTNCVGTPNLLLEHIGTIRGCCVTAFCGIMCYRGWNDNSTVHKFFTISKFEFEFLHEKIAY